jgi:hypothetical protein
MKQKVERIARSLSEQIITWDTVDAITLADSAHEEVLDPYFFLSLDVYFTREIPPGDERKGFFPDSVAFETSIGYHKDRFLLEDFPVRIEYKHIPAITSMVDNPGDHLEVYNRIGTYSLYRLFYGDILGVKSSWLQEIRTTLDNLPTSFWQVLKNSFQASLGHTVNDLESSTLQDDTYFFVLSSAQLVKKMVSLLFVINREFEPSARKSSEYVFTLPSLPENFRGRFESFLRQDGGLDMRRKAEVAELMAKSVLAMG